MDQPQANHDVPADDRQGAEAAEKKPPLNREQKRQADLRQVREGHQEHIRRLAENKAMKDVAMAVNGTCQTLAATLREVIIGRLELQSIRTADVALLIVYCEPGNELRDEVADQLMKLLKMPLVVLPKTMKVEGVAPEVLEKAGWTRLGPRSIVDAEGQPIK